MASKALKNKSIWTILIIAAGKIFIPGASDWIAAHPDVDTVIDTVVMLAVWFFTKNANTNPNPPAAK